MDTFTQVALGTAIAEAFFRRSLGRRALLFGALCGWFPDIDVFFHLPNSWDSLVNHRGITHSLICLPLIVPILGEIGFRTKQKGARSTWYHLAFWALLTHPLLDACTSYGTQLLAPISNHRFSTNAISIIDLIYSLPLFIACALAARSTNRALSKNIAQIALGMSTIYLGLCHVITGTALHRSKELFIERGFIIKTIRATPPIFLPFLRRVVARNEGGDIVVTSISVLSSETHPIHKHTWEDSTLLSTILQSDQAQIFEWFTDGFIIAKLEDTQLILTDARYGLFLDPWWSPFSANAPIENSELTGPLERSPRPSGTNYGAEYREGWRLMWGLQSQGTDSM